MPIWLAGARLWAAAQCPLVPQARAATWLVGARPIPRGCSSSAAQAQGALRQGASLQATKAFDAAEVAAFVQATGDANPLHVQGPAAHAAGFPAPIVPGMLLAALFPGLVGSAAPGALYLTQELHFRRHALVGEPVAATVTVKRASGSRVAFDTVCRNARGEVLVDGDALALLPRPGGASSAPS